MATKKSTKAKQAVLITTLHRGVFFGYAGSDSNIDGFAKDGAIVKVTDARNVIYWSADVRGFMGLAANGPSNSCRIGPKVPLARYRNVTAVLNVTPEAAAKFEAAPWG